jgi:chemotaxis protein CheX
MGASTSISNLSDVAPLTAWHIILRETAIEVFSMMVGVAIIDPGHKVPVVEEVTGIVGIAGPLTATFSLRCSLQTAGKLASKMLGVPPEKAENQKYDAVGEICNMMAGYFKAKIGLGDRCGLSVPTVLSGTNYQVRSRTGDVRMEMPFLYESEPFWIALDIRP